MTSFVTSPTLLLGHALRNLSKNMRVRIVVVAVNANQDFSLRVFVAISCKRTWCELWGGGGVDACSYHHRQRIDIVAE